jgi:hypothetical protein
MHADRRAALAESLTTKESTMRRASMLICLALLVVPLITTAQAPLLIDPGKAPLTLKGGWINVRTQQKNDLVIRIQAINPDGSFSGRADLHNADSQALCKAIDQPILEGKLTDTLLRVRIQAMNPNACPKLVVVLRAGGQRFLEGKGAEGHTFWLDAPK